MDNLKEAFNKIKEDILFLNKEIIILKKSLQEISLELKEIPLISRKISDLGLQTHMLENKTNSILKKTDILPFKPLEGKYLGISTGNKGVPTDKQTNRQTDKQRELMGISRGFLQKEPLLLKQEKMSIDSAAYVLDSLEELKKELKIKFKKLTDQEMLVFSTIYQIDEEKGFCDYKTLSLKMNLTESSIRDYVRRLILKEMPINKIKVNNKEIHLQISENLKKITTLSTILKLREV
ncbi:MAG: hypothetical protein WC812_03805 [Candidatus Pacearchaeota archaeon]